MAAEQPSSAAEYMPSNASLDEMRQAVNGCRGCDLYENATQGVFGEGPDGAEVMFVGEQPGDQEDRKGKPFVGPAGRLLDRALVEAEIDRTKVYLTNAVKHFKWEPRGKWRLHKKPSAREIAACRPWAEAEIAELRPKLIVCLGATAAQSMYGRVVRVMRERGSFERHPSGAALTVTVHPSALLRARDDESKAAQYELFLEDLRRIRAKMEEVPRPAKRAAAGEE